MSSIAPFFDPEFLDKINTASRHGHFLWKLFEFQVKALEKAIPKISKISSTFFKNPAFAFYGDVLHVPVNNRFAVLYHEENQLVLITEDKNVYLVRNDEGFRGKIRQVFYHGGPPRDKKAPKWYNDVYNNIPPQPSEII